MVKVVVAILILSGLTSCFPPTKVPIDTITYLNKEGSRQECLVVLLPGKGDRAADFEHEGFVKRIRQAGIQADIVAADLHFGYYLNGTAIERLRNDVIVPAHAKGYRRIWLVGISIGGLGALEYEIKYPSEAYGIVLLAPYLGGASIVDEIVQAGSLQAWNPGMIAESDQERRLWEWIRNYESQGRHGPAIYLGYGTDDRFASGDKLLAGVLGADRTITTPGGHAWSTWKVLWESLVRRISSAAACKIGIENYKMPCRNLCGDYNR